MPVNARYVCTQIGHNYKKVFISALDREHVLDFLFAIIELFSLALTVETL